MLITSKPVPLVRTWIGEDEIEAVARVMRTGQLAEGPEVAAFEREFAASAGTKHAVALNSGTAAIHAGLTALGVGPGDEVVTTPFTFAATATPILMCGATPRFVDVDPRTYNADLTHLAAAVTEKTRAVVAVDLFGLPFDRTGIEALQERGVAVFEDACQAVGARRDGRTAGALADAASFSFYATKNVMTGEGGMLTTDRDEIAAAAKRFRQHGMGERYTYVSLGYNYRLTDVLAAIGRVQLARLDEINARRRANAARYDAGLGGIDGLTTPFVPAGVEHAYHQYSILIDGAATKSGRDRDAVRAFCAERGVGTGIYYPSGLHRNPLFADLGYGEGAFPVAESLANRILALPIHPLLESEDVETVIATLREAVGA